MSTILASLSKYCNIKHDDWDVHVPFIQLAYNTTPSIDTTDYSPYFLLHGRHPRFPADTTFDLGPKVSVTTADYISQLVTGVEKARQFAQDLLSQRKEIMVKKFSKKVDMPDFQVGDTVFLYSPVLVPGQTRKLARPWCGPYYVIERLSDIHVRIRRKCDGKLVKNRVHIERLKKATINPDIPDDNTVPGDADALPPVILA